MIFKFKETKILFDLSSPAISFGELYNKFENKKQEIPSNENGNFNKKTKEKKLTLLCTTIIVEKGSPVLSHFYFPFF